MLYIHFLAMYVRKAPRLQFFVISQLSIELGSTYLNTSYFIILVLCGAKLIIDKKYWICMSLISAKKQLVGAIALCKVETYSLIAVLLSSLENALQPLKYYQI